MSKQDEFRLKVAIEADLNERLCDDFLKAVNGLYGESDRATTSVEAINNKIFIIIKARDINITRSMVNGYLQSLKTVEEMDKL